MPRRRKAGFHAKTQRRKNKKMNDLLALIAEKELGLREEPRGSNRGDFLKKFFEADDLKVAGQTDGYPWCAAFVSWCIQQWLDKLCEGGLRIQGFAAPRTARAFELEKWGAENGCLVFRPERNFPPERGDLAIYAFSHCGIVALPILHKIAPDKSLRHDDPQPVSGDFAAVEGNTYEEDFRSQKSGDTSRDAEGYMVALRSRSLKHVRCFVRLPNAGDLT